MRDVSRPKYSTDQELSGATIARDLSSEPRVAGDRTVMNESTRFNSLAALAAAQRRPVNEVETAAATG
ncbi:MAG: hypothetical protein O3B86_14910 [Planctomycetota bacterium]|nr:hypothetical protein [Planctomycetota bacterium]